MKLWKRAIALVLILTVGLVGFEFPEAAPSSALAEYVPVGTTVVSENPDALLSSGEWLYWLEGDNAIIAGYTNHSERSLKIPGHLNGHPVVGIGHKAFEANAALKSLYIHNNVTHISEDAFSGLSSLTISAYNGSFALWYARRCGIASNNKSSTKGQTLAEGAIDMSGAPKKSYFNLTDGSVTVKVADTAFLRQGDAIYFPPQDGFPTGLARRIDAISYSGDTAVVWLGQPEFAEVFKEIHGEETVFVDWEHAVLSDGIELEQIEPAKKGTVKSPNKYKVSFDLGAKFSGSKIAKKFSIAGKIGLELGPAQLKYDIGVKGLMPNVKLLQFDLPVKTVQSASLKFKHKITDASKGTGIITNRIPLSPEVPFCSAGGVVNGYLRVDLVCEINGEITFSSTVEVTHSFTLKNGKPGYSKSERTSNSSLEIGGSFKIGPEMKVYLVLGWSGVSIRFLEGSIGGFLTISGSTKFTGVHGAKTVVNCIDASIAVTITVGLKIGIVKFFSVDGPAFNISRDITLFKKTLGHWDDLKSVRNCTLLNRAVVLDYGLKELGKKLIKVNVNQRIPEEKPHYDGYTFDGWYVDKSLSRLSGANERWNFAEGMPYIADYGALFLYGRWRDKSGNLIDLKTPPPSYTPENNDGDGGNGGSSGGGGSEGGWIATPVPSPTPTPTPTPPPVPVTAIRLNKTSAEFYKGDANGTLQLTATVEPANATSKEVTWESSNDCIATVDKNGLVKIGDSGIATITCRSAVSGEITANCQIVVKQKVEEIFVETADAAIAPGETMQLKATCFPENSENKAVTWSTADAGIATVSNTGVVTGVKVGTVKISATAQDGSKVVGSYDVTVEPELSLAVDAINETLYLGGEDDCALAYVSATPGSVRRMREKGLTLNWKIVSEGQNAESTFDTMKTVVEDKGKRYDSTLVMLSTRTIKSLGPQTVTVACEAGDYSASAEVKVNIVENEYASELKLDQSTLSTDVDEAVLLTNAPAAKDGKPVPSDLEMEIGGDRYWQKYATETAAENGIAVSFSESGIYEAKVIYRRANLSYAVPVTVYVRDADGTVHRRITDIVLSDDIVDMVEGEHRAVSFELTPSEAFNKSVSWQSEDESVATVSQSGSVTAIAPGMTTVYCEAQDGSEIFAACAVRVESFLNLDETAIDRTLYTGGNPQSDIETVNITIDSEKRLQEAGLNVTWALEKVSGTSTELALEEYASIGEGGISVSGNRIKLVRINGVGQDEYLLKCTAGQYADSCAIRLDIVEGALPSGVSLNRTVYEGRVEEPIEIDTTPVCTPGDSALPEDVEIVIDGSKSFRNALSEDYSVFDASRLIFAKAGEYSASVVFSGANYRYACPVTIRVSDADGKVPEIIQDVAVEPQRVTLLAGESLALSPVVTPSNATYSKPVWSSYDTSVATVSENGVVTAIDAGMTGITISIPETDIETTCLVVVEDGMTLQETELERTVFADGTTRMDLDGVMLTEASSQRLGKAPEWKLERVSGNSLTLRASAFETLGEDGKPIYGCRIKLYSVSRTGDTVYNLTATSGDEHATARITVHAVNRDDVLPASLELSRTEYEADVGELIVIEPEVTCWPAGTALPAGIRVAFEGDRQFTDAVNASDYFVSQSRFTLSFSEPGAFDADCVYTYANVRYVIPLKFKIRDEKGNVPVLTRKVQLNRANVSLVKGDTFRLDAVFTPADATDQSVTWSSSDSKVATVSADGLVRAESNGQCVVTCTPKDTHSAPAKCAITVEDFFTVETGATSVTLYLQGGAANALSSARLSDGTLERLDQADLKPEWSIEKDGVTHAVIDAGASEAGDRFDVETTGLLSGGTDSYVVRCKAGDYSWSQDYSLEVVDLGSQAPKSVGIKADSVSVGIGTPVTIDFTPSLQPEGAALPGGMSTYYVGIGEFYDAMIPDSYREDGDCVTAAFNRAGRYVISRQYFLGNLHYTTACTVNVSASDSDRCNLLTASETEYTVYAGGKSGVVSTVSLNDGMISQEWGDSLEWKAERISGNSITATVKPRGSQADLYVASVENEGTDKWRVSCTFGGITDWVDIQLTAVSPRKALPESIALQTDHLTGTIGNWITAPLGVRCTPEGAALPDTGDAFWSLEMNGQGRDAADYEVKNNLLYVNFAESGYYTGSLRYQAGNVAYSIPLCFTVEDEEGVVKRPDLNLYLVDMADTVYPEGETDVVIGKAVVSESLSTYHAGSAAAYLENQDPLWSIRTESGTAAQLSLKKATDNIYDIVLADINGAGDITYSVSCAMKDGTLKEQGALHVAAEGEPRPDATLKRTKYTVAVNEELSIDRGLYTRSDGSMLQSSTTWDADALLSVMGYGYRETDTKWMATFYKPGEYTSEVTGYVGNLPVRQPLNITVTPAEAEAELSVLLLPAALTGIPDEAFVGISADVVDLRGTNVCAIGSNAFANCTDLKMAYLPQTVLSIADDAFYGCLNVTIYCVRDSEAAKFAERNNLSAVYMD